MRLTGIDLPRWVLLPAGLGALFLIVPVLAIVVGTDWLRFGELITSPAAVDALRLSLITSGAATIGCVVLGVPLALLLARARFAGQQLLRSVVLLPLVLPPVVSGLALLHTFGRAGLLGSGLDAIGVRIAFSTVAVILAQTFVSLPFLVLTLEGALSTAGTAYADIAATLGAAPWRVFSTVTLPLVAPGLLAGTVLAFARSLGEFGATLTFAGSLQGTTRTLPLEIYLQRETDVDAALALSLLLIMVALVVVIFAHRRAVIR